MKEICSTEKQVALWRNIKLNGKSQTYFNRTSSKFKKKFQLYFEKNNV